LLELVDLVGFCPNENVARNNERVKKYSFILCLVLAEFKIDADGNRI
jgi:hypothetical protein